MQKPSQASLKNFWHIFGRNVRKRSPSTMFWDHPFANSARYPGSRVAAGTPLLFRLNWVTALDEGSWILYWIFLGDLTSRNWGLISWVLIGLIGFHGIELVAICCEGIHGCFHGFWYWSVQFHVNWPETLQITEDIRKIRFKKWFWHQMEAGTTDHPTTEFIPF